VKGITLFITAFLLSNYLHAFETESKLVEGIKYSQDKNESVLTKALLPTNDSYLGGYNELLPYVVPAPYQDNAGSCLFMSHTGALEVLMNQKKNRTRNTKLNLSERYFMNLQKLGVGDDLISNWRTDTIYRLNKTGKTYLNKRFRFTKGWYKTVNGKRVPAEAEEEGAFYGTKYNWITDLGSLSKTPKITLPKFKREVIFADPSENQWNVGTAPKDIATRIKNAIRKNKAPVVVIYNHVGFWHATLVVGFNDYASTEGCPFVSQYDEKMNKRADEIVKEADETEDASIKKKLLRKAAKFRKRGNAVQTSFINDGGCKKSGVFYVRDSIYPNEEQPLYDFDLNNEGEEEHLNAPVILRSYAWAEQLSNHAVLIRIK
tara:strand:- start:4314 stop:5438 length:1125 start_codon:yes stop_codon:yes gene_type:complete